MKTYLLSLLLFFFFFINSASSFPTYQSIESGQELVVIVKQSSVSFFIPDQYFYSDGSLIMPLQLSIEKNGKFIYSIQSQSVINNLPNLNMTKGDYKMTIVIGNYQEVKKFNGQL